MSVLVTQRLLTLNAATPLFQSAPVAVDPLTDAITLRLRRPTTAAPLAWLATAVLRVSLVLVIDGEEFVCSGEVSGGIRLNGLGIEIPDYRLVYQPTVHWTGGQSRRIGQRTQTAITAYVKLERLRGSIATELLLAATTESPPPDMSSHNSVAFDAATSATEQGGDGVLSLSHTAGGADRAAFIGVSVAFSGDSGGTVTYGGNAATSLFEDDSTQIGVSGFYYVAPPASAQTVTSDLVATAPFSHNLHVISMTGVDPTTPVGTPVVVTAGFDTNPSVTVGSVGADDLVVDVMACTIANSGVTIGASQTQRTIQDNSGPDSHRTSTQSGANGGVMSWTYAGSTWRSLGAVAFKPAAPPTVALTGTVTASITEADIVAGGKTVILTVTDDTVVPASVVQTIGYIANALGGTTDTTSFSITLPATQAGDILILEFCHRGTGIGTIGGTSVTTGGLTWTNKHSQLFAASAFSGQLYWTRATGDHSGQTVTGSGLTNACAAIVTQYRNCVASGDPFANAATIVGEQNASGNVTQAEITTLVDGCMVCLTVLNSPDLAVATQACTTPGALAERAERLSTGGTDASIAHASEIRTAAGATGAFTWTQTAAASGSYAYALQPAVTTPFADARAAVRDGGDSAQSEAGGWDAKVKPNIPLGNIARTSDNVITLVLQAQGDFDITAPETITWTVPGSALTGGSPIVATPTFTIDSGGTAYTLTAAPGSFTITGTAATLKRGLRVAAVGGTYAVTGTAATVKYGHRIAAVSGAYAVTGTAATFRRTYAVSALSGPFIVTGTVAGVKRGLKIAAASGAYTVTGTAATVKRGLKIGAVAGAYAITGTDATFRRTLAIQAASGSFAITGTAATFRRTYVFSAQDGAYAITGADASLLHETSGVYTLGATSGAYAVTGSTAQVATGRKLSAATGAYTITGTAANLKHAARLTALSGAFALTGTAADLGRGLHVGAASGSYAWTGTATGFRRDLALIAVSGAYVVTGTTATLVPSELPPLLTVGITETLLTGLVLSEALATRLTISEALVTDTEIEESLV